jgi:hypothetical protein
MKIKLATNLVTAPGLDMYRPEGKLLPVYLIIIP